MVFGILFAMCLFCILAAPAIATLVPLAPPPFGQATHFEPPQPVLPTMAGGNLWGGGDHFPNLDEEELNEEDPIHTSNHLHRKLQQANGVASYTIQLTNLCKYPVMPGVFSGAAKYKDHPEKWANGGFKNMATGQWHKFNVPSDIADLEVWPRVGCSNNDATKCTSGGCAPGDNTRASIVRCHGKTQVRFDFGRPGGDVANVNNAINGWNVPVKVVVVSNPSCGTIHDTNGSTKIAQNLVCHNRGQKNEVYSITYCPSD